MYSRTLKDIKRIAKISSDIQTIVENEQNAFQDTKKKIDGSLLAKIDFAISHASDAESEALFSSIRNWYTDNGFLSPRQQMSVNTIIAEVLWEEKYGKKD